MKSATIQEVIEDLQQGRMVVVQNDEQSVYHLVLPAEKATAESVGFMARHGNDLLYLALSSQQMNELCAPSAAASNAKSQKLTNAFAVSAETGCKAAPSLAAKEYAAAIRAFANPSVGIERLATPGRIIYLRVYEGGVLACPAAGEAAVDLARLAGLPHASVISRLSIDGQPQFDAFAATHGLKLICISDLIAFRRQYEKSLSCTARVRMPTHHGEFSALVFEDHFTGLDHLALVMGEVNNARPVLVRIHSECLTGDVLGSLRCDCGSQLNMAAKYIAENGRGILVYLRQEGRGIGLANKLRAYALQEQGLDTVEANERLGFPADLRDFSLGAEILSSLGVREVRLLTNNPSKVSGIEKYGVKVTERVPLVVPPTAENLFYLQVKHQKMGHLLPPEGLIHIK